VYADGLGFPNPLNEGGKIDIINEHVNINKNETANVELNLYVNNDSGQLNYLVFSFFSTEQNKQFVNFSCRYFLKELATNSIINVDENSTNITSKDYEKILWIENHNPAYIQIYCHYTISNYTTSEIPGEWTVYDYFGNKHNAAKTFDLYVMIPNGTRFTTYDSSIIKPEFCDEGYKRYGCAEYFRIRYSSNEPYKSPSIYFRFEEIPLSLINLFYRNLADWILAWFIGVIMSFFLFRKR